MPSKHDYASTINYFHTCDASIQSSFEVNISSLHCIRLLVYYFMHTIIIIFHTRSPSIKHIIHASPRPFLHVPFISITMRLTAHANPISQITPPRIFIISCTIAVRFPWAIGLIVIITSQHYLPYLYWR
jgi:hypothetical protein